MSAMPDSDILKNSVPLAFSLKCSIPKVRLQGCIGLINCAQLDNTEAFGLGLTDWSADSLVAAV